MAASEKFCLRWNDFESNVSTAFRDLREEKDFFDVTLACDDSSQVAAHKVILAACSPFFRDVLRRNPHSHPLLYLKGVKYKELLSVLNFMYQGEVNVAQEELNQFLAVAEDLRVKGLTQGNSSSDSKPKSEAKPRSVPVELPPPKRQRTAPAPAVSSASFHHQDDDEIQEVVPVKSEPAGADNSGYVADEGGQQGTVALEDAYNEEGYDYGQYGEGGYDDGSGMIDPNTGMPLEGADGNKVQELDDIADIEKAIDEQIGRIESGHWCCYSCDYVNPIKSTVRAHIEAKHISSSGFQCLTCNRICPTRHALKMHRLRNKH